MMKGFDNTKLKRKFKVLLLPLLLEARKINFDSKIASEAKANRTLQENLLILSAEGRRSLEEQAAVSIIKEINRKITLT